MGSRLPNSLGNQNFLHELALPMEPAYLSVPVERNWLYIGVL